MAYSIRRLSVSLGIRTAQVVLFSASDIRFSINSPPTGKPKLWLAKTHHWGIINIILILCLDISNTYSCNLNNNPNQGQSMKLPAIDASLVVWIFFGVGIAMMAFVNSDHTKTSTVVSKRNNNFDGTYTIPHTDSICLGTSYQFKLMHQRDGHGSASHMYRGNCRRLSNGDLEGYIYAKSRPKLRIFWASRNGVVCYKDKNLRRKFRKPVPNPEQRGAPVSPKISCDL